MKTKLLFLTVLSLLTILSQNSFALKKNSGSQSHPGCKPNVTVVSCSIERNERYVREYGSGGWQIQYLSKTTYCNGGMKFDTGIIIYETEDTAIDNLCALVANNWCPENSLNHYPTKRDSGNNPCYGL